MDRANALHGDDACATRGVVSSSRGEMWPKDTSPIDCCHDRLRIVPRVTRASCPRGLLPSRGHDVRFCPPIRPLGDRRRARRRRRARGCCACGVGCLRGASRHPGGPGRGPGSLGRAGVRVPGRAHRRVLRRGWPLSAAQLRGWLLHDSDLGFHALLRLRRRPRDHRLHRPRPSGRPPARTGDRRRPPLRAGERSDRRRAHQSVVRAARHPSGAGGDHGSRRLHRKPGLGRAGPRPSRTRDRGLPISRRRGSDR